MRLSGEKFTNKNFLKVMKNKSIFWDTTLLPCDFPPFIKKKFFILGQNKRKKFVQWMGKISEKNIIP